MIPPQVDAQAARNRPGPGHGEWVEVVISLLLGATAVRVRLSTPVVSRLSRSRLTIEWDAVTTPGRTALPTIPLAAHALTETWPDKPTDTLMLPILLICAPARPNPRGGRQPRYPAGDLAARMGTMTLDEAVRAVAATLDSGHLRVDRKLAREDASSYLVLVLDTSGGRGDDGGPVANGPRLVDKASGRVRRLTVPDAVARADRMALVAS